MTYLICCNKVIFQDESISGFKVVSLVSCFFREWLVLNDPIIRILVIVMLLRPVSLLEFRRRCDASNLPRARLS